MARAPRIRFAAPLVITLAAGCPSTVDHRPTQPPPITGTGPIANPPPTAAGASWRVEVGDNGVCLAVNNASMDCPEGASCNPPPPARIECPAGATNEHPYTIQQQGSECTLIAPAPECKPGVMCNPPPAQKTACPEY